LQVSLTYFISVCVILVLSGSSSIYAEEYRAKLIKVAGDVHVVDADGNHHAVQESNFLVREMETIVTAQSGNAVVKFNDGSLSVLDRNSSLRVGKTGWLSHLGGRIYFVYNKVFGGERRVETRFATIGIRGTSFIVYDHDTDQAVALQEGLLAIKSIGPAFEIYREQNLDEFDDYKQQVLDQQQLLNDEYDDYTEKVQREFVEYRQSFTLKPERIVRFDGARVNEGLINEDIRDEFENFESIAGRLLEEFREQSQRYRETLEQQQQLDEADFE
jgi:hypothetical protein